MGGSSFAYLLVALSLASAGCQPKSTDQCYCPASGHLAATIEFACPVASSAIQATGECSAALQGEGILVTAGDAGQCQVDVTTNGSSSSFDFQVTSVWLACGSDPHGCGEAFALTPSFVEVEAGTPCGDGGADTRTSD